MFCISFILLRNLCLLLFCIPLDKRRTNCCFFLPIKEDWIYKKTCQESTEIKEKVLFEFSRLFTKNFDLIHINIMVHLWKRGRKRTHKLKIPNC